MDERNKNMVEFGKPHVKNIANKFGMKESAVRSII